MTSETADGSGAAPESPLLATRDLLRSAKDGDEKALAELMGRYVPRLKRWASGRQQNRPSPRVPTQIWPPASGYRTAASGGALPYAGSDLVMTSFPPLGPPRRGRLHICDS